MGNFFNVKCGALIFFGLTIWNLELQPSMNIVIPKFFCYIDFRYSFHYLSISTIFNLIYHFPFNMYVLRKPCHYISKTLKMKDRIPLARLLGYGWFQISLNTNIHFQWDCPLRPRGSLFQTYSQFILFVDCFT